MAGKESEDLVTLEEEVEGEAEDEGRAGHRLPLARVKRIMKADPDLHLASQDAVFLVTKATVIDILIFVLILLLLLFLSSFIFLV